MCSVPDLFFSELCPNRFSGEPFFYARGFCTVRSLTAHADAVIPGNQENALPQPSVTKFQIVQATFNSTMDRNRKRSRPPCAYNIFFSVKARYARKREKSRQKFVSLMKIPKKEYETKSITQDIAKMWKSEAVHKILFQQQSRERKEDYETHKKLWCAEKQFVIEKKMMTEEFHSRESLCYSSSELTIVKRCCLLKLSGDFNASRVVKKFNS